VLRGTFPGLTAEIPRKRALSDRELRAGVGGCVVAVGAFLALRLTAWPPHEDETLALFIGRGSLDGLLDTVLGERGGAPLHFVLAWLVAHLGGGLTALRAVSAVFALASIPLVAALAARLAGRTAAVLAAALASASWVLLFHGVYARMYSVFLFASALSYLALLAALRAGGRRAWALWVAASLLCVATHPYGALVLASQGVFVALVRERLREAALAFGTVAVLGIPFWITDVVLAGRFDVEVGGGGEKLGGPLPVAAYLGRVAADFSAGPWALPVVLPLAAVGAWQLARRRPRSALLVAAVFATPTAAFLLARVGGAASPESRHLIFALPFFVTLVGAGLVGVARAREPRGVALVAAAAGALVVGELAWAWQKTPALFVGDPQLRVEARRAAAEWLAATGRPDDVLLGYEPIYLGAWERNNGFSRLVLPRADAKLAVSQLERAGSRLGRGVWLFDAYDTNNVHQRLTIPLRLPRPASAFEARVFGPYLVIRTREPTGSPHAYLERAAAALVVGKTLDIGDADVNFDTVSRAAALLGYEATGPGPSRSTSSR
jgi:Dolichyl-phosphate-mannose-protein mannosyltransferase